MVVTTQRRADWAPKPAAETAPTPDTIMGPEWGWGSFADITTVEVHWLWFPYIPKGRLSSIEGDPGVGKSWMISAIASAVSTGSPLPGQDVDPDRRPGKVLILSGEDGLADTIKPRLEACGANMANIHFPTKNGAPAKFILDAKGSAWLAEAMKVLDLAVVFIDPVQLFMGGKVDMNRANEVREFLDAIHTAAEATDCAVILVRHFNKGKNPTALYKGLGSIDFAASVRSIIQVELGANEVRQAHHVKCNNAAEGGTITYTVNPFMWGPIIPRALPAPKVSRTPRKSEAAREFITQMLAQGPKSAVDIIVQGQAAGFTAATLNFAKQGIAKSRKLGRGEWVWELKDKDDTDDPIVGEPETRSPSPGVGVEDHGPGEPSRGGVDREAGDARDPRGAGAAPLGVGVSPEPNLGAYDPAGGASLRRDGPVTAAQTGTDPGLGGVRPLAPWEQELARIRGRP